jgi:glutaredoxin-like YruB-family protein
MVEKATKKVIVYSTQTCPYCVMAKDFLKENKIAFRDVDVGADEKAAQEMIDKSGQMGVPVIDVDGKIIVGFDREALRDALSLK